MPLFKGFGAEGEMAQVDVKVEEPPLSPDFSRIRGKLVTDAVNLFC